MKKYNYAAEKLTNMLEVLATHSGDVRERLAAAYWTFGRLKPEDLPEETRKDLDWIRKALAKRGPLIDITGKQVRGSIENTMRYTRKATAQKIAKKLYELYWSVSGNKRYE